MKIGVLKLRPTQFVLGMREVEDKIDKIENMKPKELKEWLVDHRAPCVVGPRDKHYIIDHHHFVAACYHTGIAKVPIEVLEDKRSLSYKKFWEFMRGNGWLYLRDQFGRGPHDPSVLPLNIRGMGDDIYRSLAWELREAGIIEKVQKPYAEFTWAQYLRKNLKADLHAESYSDVVKKALRLAKNI